MKILYLNLNMGAAGDMLNAALYELLSENKKAEYLQKMASLGLPGVEITPEPSVKCGIVGTHMRVTVGGIDEGETHHHHDHDHDHEHEHDHHHDHGHTHSHRSMHEIEHIVAHLPLSEKVKADVIAVYRSIAEAEGAVHGKAPGEIHFHEVGTMDAIADVAGCCLLMEMLAPDRVVASPVRVGNGTVRCAHGILPVPAPATAILLEGIPTEAGDFGGTVKGELCTPTGAALIRRFADEFGTMPAIRTIKTGYGMGTKDFPVLNAVTATLGQTDESAFDRVLEMACNLDDMTPEDIGYACTVLLDAGALDVWTTPIGMKKSRPGIMLSLLCPEDEEEKFAGLLLKHTTTLGVRIDSRRRKMLTRTFETMDTPYGSLTVKRSEGEGIRRTKAEFDDLAAIAKSAGMSLAELREKLGKV